jgi:hypothetical protein
MAPGRFIVQHIAKDGQRVLHDGWKVHDGRHGGSLLTALKALGRQRVILHYTPSSLLCKTSVLKQENMIFDSCENCLHKQMRIRGEVL